MKEGESLPCGLDSKNFRDVTEQYIPTTDVHASLVFPPPRPASVAYVCVFNGGEWRPIHWSRITDGKAVFTRMGRGVVYLPAYYDSDHVVAAAPPFILDEKGQVTPLTVEAGDATRLSRLSLAAKDTDAKSPPSKEAKPAERCELYLWDRGWQPLAHLPAGPPRPGVCQKLPPGRLYWATSPNDRETARIFTIESGKQRSW